MYRSIFTFTLLFICHFVFGQVSTAIEIGLNQSTYDMDLFANTGYSSSTNYYVGLHSEVPVSEKWSVGLDFEISQRGVVMSRFEDPSWPEDTTVIYQDMAFRFTYFDVQPYIIYNLNENLSFGLGLYAGLNFWESSKRGGGDWQNINQLQFISTWDNGMLLNARYRFKKFSLKVEYNWGFSSVNNFVYLDAFRNPVSGDNLQLRNLQIGLAYFLKE